MVAPGQQRGHQGQEVVFHEQHRGDHDVTPGDVGSAALECCRLVAPLCGRMHTEREARHGAGQAAMRSLGGTGQVTVHRDEHHPHGRCICTAHRHALNG